MKKKFSLEIKNPCRENFSEMKVTDKGSFCNSCAKNVIDLSMKTNHEIARFIADNKNENICAKMRISQLEDEFEYEETSKVSNLKYAVAVAATILLTSNVLGQEKNTVKTEVNSVIPIPQIMGKIAYHESKTSKVSLTLKGKILEKSTNKGLSQKKYSNLMISTSGFSVKVNPKTGEFTLPISIDKTTKELFIAISSDNYLYSKSLKMNQDKLDKKELNLNFIINSEKEMQNQNILGGLGVNYIKPKKTNIVS